MNASSISRQLRRDGFLPVPRGREGLHVTRGAAGRVAVTADLDAERAAKRMADAAFVALVAAGYTLAESGAPNIFYVTGKAS